ncbi:MAG: lytic transglycosylase domain-containing protein [Bryobacteraceae bacterium]
MTQCFLILCVFATCASAGEYAILSTGFRLHADSHETAGNTVRLHTREGAIELPAATVVGFEKEEFTPPVPIPAPQSIAPTVVPPSTTKELVTEAAKHAGLPPALVHSVARAESAYQPTAVSNKGAIGIMQLMPNTAAQLHADPRDPKQNAEAGAMYLRELLLKYDGTVSKALAAYNAGPGAVDKYHGVPPYRETINYVNRVIQQYEKTR